MDEAFKDKARKAVARAVKAGKLYKPVACERCTATTNIQGHHHDYTKPLEVEWVCPKCHTDIHHPYARIIPNGYKETLKAIAKEYNIDTNVLRY